MITRFPSLALLWWIEQNFPEVTSPIIDVRQQEDLSYIIERWECGAAPKPSDIVTETIISDYLLSKEHYADVFDVTLCKEQLLAAFAAELVNMSQYYSVLSDCLYYKNFTATKQFCDSLLAAGKITPEEYAAFKAILMNQNINLDEF